MTMILENLHTITNQSNIDMANESIYFDKNHFYWYYFLCQIQAMPKIKESYFSMSGFYGFFKKYLEQTDGYDDILDKINHYSKYHIAKTHHKRIDKDADFFINKQLDVNDEKAINALSDTKLYSLLINHLSCQENVYFDGDYQHLSVLEAINTYGIPYSFYLFRLYVQKLYETNNEQFAKFSQYLGHQEKMGIRLINLETLYFFYRELCQIKFRHQI